MQSPSFLKRRGKVKFIQPPFLHWSLLVGITLANSNAPMSMMAMPLPLPSCGRATPRWSVAGAPALLPASMALLPGKRACVGVCPPLFLRIGSRFVTAPRRNDGSLRENSTRTFGKFLAVLKIAVKPAKTRLRRELAEEVGIVPIEWQFLLTFYKPNLLENGEGQYHFYLITAWSGQPANLQPEEHSEVFWFNFEDAINLPCPSPLYVKKIEQILNQS